ncbi:MAG: sugar nucleotide-binding protein [Halieaceae bacterium]|nr:sugar nucleotide-binding protein [Halieaceae bacterium]MCP4466601.1 sugar nucleotide-binding protein [Halieaceae bacterium]MDG2411502.1 sugar nucleotide-binding protein [Halioglobus sp.]
MRVLLLGFDTPLGAAIVERQTILGRHELITMSRSACRWKSERQAKKSVVRAKSDIVVDVRVEAAGDSGTQIQQQDLQRCHWVAKACQRSGTAYLFVSSSRVFSGQLDRPYVETDRPDNDETVGQLLAQAEQFVEKACQRHLLLRFGPVFSDGGTNLISQILGPLSDGDSLILDNNLRGCPIAAADGARVILAILDQLGTGLEAWGRYHYGSSDTATYYEFAEALLAAASQFSEFSSSAVQLESESGDLASLDRTLDCALIRNTFAIRQVPWRSAIGDLVKHYYEKN